MDERHVAASKLTFSREYEEIFASSSISLSIFMVDVIVHTATDKAGIDSTDNSPTAVTGIDSSLTSSPKKATLTVQSPPSTPEYMSSATSSALTPAATPTATDQSVSVALGTTPLKASSKIESILFTPDDGPASTLLTTMLTSSSQHSASSTSEEKKVDDATATATALLKDSASIFSVETSSSGVFSLASAETQRIRNTHATSEFEEDEEEMEEEAGPSIQRHNNNSKDHDLPIRNVRFLGVGESPPATPARSDFPSTIVTASSSTADVLEQLNQAQELLVQVQMDLSAERALRKRKEKNLVKLAKELNIRATDGEAKDKRIVKMAETINEMEVKLAAYHREITEAQLKYRTVTHESDTRLAELQKRYDTTTATLSQQVLEARLESDRLRSKLAALEMKASPEEADKIKERAMRDAHVMRSATPRQGPKISASLLLGSAAAGAALLAVVLGWTFDLHQGPTAAVANLCSPIQPGTELMAGKILPTPITYDAPWWVPSTSPSSWRGSAHDMLCSGCPRTRLVWNGDRLSAQYIVVKRGTGQTSAQQQDDVVVTTKTLWTRRVVGSARMASDKIFLQDKAGVVKEELSAPWLPSNQDA